MTIQGNGWSPLVKKAFPGNGGILHGNPQVMVTDGNPASSSITNALAWDVTNSDGYICTVPDSATWVKINA